MFIVIPLLVDLVQRKVGEGRVDVYELDHVAYARAAQPHAEPRRTHEQWHACRELKVGILGPHILLAQVVAVVASDEQHLGSGGDLAAVTQLLLLQRLPGRQENNLSFFVFKSTIFDEKQHRLVGDAELAIEHVDERADLRVDEAARRVVAHRELVLHFRRERRVQRRRLDGRAVDAQHMLYRVRKVPCNRWRVDRQCDRRVQQIAVSNASRRTR